jgi:tetratricopeptide (TPR) repeat protein
VRARFFVVFAAGSSLLLGGCSRLANYAAAASADRMYERGEYQKAAAAYLGLDADEFPATVAYDLANVYARLGEHRAAAALYAEARRADLADASAVLAAASFYNEGLSLYEQGRFEEAWHAFRGALSCSSGDAKLERDARFNLELAWRAWKKRTEPAPPGAAPTQISVGGPREAEIRLFERMETGKWRPGKSGKPSGGPDY